jgi:hypothetical protein
VEGPAAGDDVDVVDGGAVEDVEDWLWNIVPSLS